MVKVPVAGRAKTRLALAIGVGRAIGIYRAMTTATVARVLCPRRWNTYLAVTPDTGASYPFFRARLTQIGQGRGDLGARMQRLMMQLPPGPVIIIGTDVPGISTMHIARAFRQLASHDGVFGPSRDGGYWLTGLRRRPRVPRAFDNVRWSASETLEDTLANLTDLRVAFADALDDVDDVDDLRRLGHRIGRIVS